MNNTVYPMAMNAVLYGLVVGGGLIGAVGFALLLKSIKLKSLWPFFLLGFFFAADLNINMIGIGVLAVICVALYYYLKVRNEIAE